MPGATGSSWPRARRCWCSNGWTTPRRAAHGAHAALVPFSGTKGLYGHPLGASGAIETAISALAIQHAFLPGTTNLERPDQDNPLRLIPPCGEPCQPRVVLNNAFGFGG